MPNQEKPLKVLIVEDRVLVAEALKQSVEQLGHQVTGTASNYTDAMRYVSAVWPDLVLMDIIIDGNRDGIDTAQAIQQVGPAPIIFLTDSEADPTYQRAKQVANAWFINKPISTIQLKRTIDQYLAHYHQKSHEPDKEAVPNKEGIIVVRHGYTRVRVLLKDVIYIEGSRGKKLKYVIDSNEPLTESASMTQRLTEMKQLPGGGQMIQISRRHAVNLTHCHELANNQIVLTNQERLPVGKGFVSLVYPFFQ